MIEAMKPFTDKQVQRLENKKKKLAAFLEIAKLNDLDREVKTKLRTRDSTSSEDSDDGTEAMPKVSRCKKKRIKTHHDVFPDERCSHRHAEHANGADVDEGFGGSPASQPKDTSHDRISLLVADEEMPTRASDTGPSGKPKLVGEELARLRAKLRERKKILTKLPLFRLRTEGERAAIDVAENERTPLFLSDIQHLLLYSLIGTKAPYSPFAWCQFEKHNRVSHTVVLLVEGLSLYDYLAHQSCFPRLNAAFTSRLEVVTPSAYDGSFVEELALIPMTHNKEMAMIQRYGSLEAALRADGDVYRLLRAIFPVLASDETAEEGAVGAAAVPVGEAVTYKALAHNDRFPRTHLVMSPSQLIGEGFPLPLKGALKNKFRDYVMTKDLYKEVTPRSPMFALDCEMCMTTSGLTELTRISIVDEELNCLYDELVLPYNRIVNYLTRFSGITAEMMATATKRLEDVQHDMRRLLPTDAILIGQSLNCDLHSMKMMHPYVIDTSVIFNVTSNYRRKTKLSTLSLRFLGEEIQASTDGHCSTEDSEACMKLVQLKLANSVAFGDTILASYRPEYRSLTQPQVEVSPNSTASPTCYIKYGEVQPQSDDPASQPTIYQYYPVSKTSVAANCQTASADKPAPKVGATPAWPAQGEQLATTLFSYLKSSDKTVGIVSTPTIVEEYSRWINTPKNGKRPKTPVPSVENISVDDNRKVFDRTTDVAPKHAFTVGHVRYDETSFADVDEEARATFFREVDESCGRVWDSVQQSGLCVVLFGGRKGGANGACFVEIKREGHAAYRTKT